MNKIKQVIKWIVLTVFFIITTFLAGLGLGTLYNDWYLVGTAAGYILFISTLWILYNRERDEHLNKITEATEFIGTLYKRIEQWEDKYATVLGEKTSYVIELATAENEIEALTEKLTLYECTTRLDHVLPGGKLPFGDEIPPLIQYQCEECGSYNMKETKVYVTCQDCGKRRRKETE